MFFSMCTGSGQKSAISGGLKSMGVKVSSEPGPERGNRAQTCAECHSVLLFV